MEKSEELIRLAMSNQDFIDNVGPIIKDLLTEIANGNIRTIKIDGKTFNVSAEEVSNERTFF
jgi:hypothetical protein